MFRLWRWRTKLVNFSSSVCFLSFSAWSFWFSSSIFSFVFFISFERLLMVISSSSRDASSDNCSFLRVKMVSSSSDLFSSCFCFSAKRSFCPSSFWTRAVSSSNLFWKALIWVSMSVILTLYSSILASPKVLLEVIFKSSSFSFSIVPLFVWYSKFIFVISSVIRAISIFSSSLLVLV